MNSEQVKGILERMLYIIIPLLAGWIGLGNMDPATVGTIVGAILAVIGVFLGWKQNTAASLAVAAAKQPEVTEVKVTDPDIKEKALGSHEAYKSIKVTG